MAATTLPTTHDDVSTAETRSMRRGVLIHPTTAQSGRFLILPHPRTFVPTYYLYSPSSPSSSGELFELSTLTDSKYDRSWMISHLNQVISSGQLDILSRVDARFLVISLLYSVLGGDAKFRSREDTFDQIALVLQAKRREQMKEAIPALKVEEGKGVQEEWTDVVAFGNLPLVTKALEDVADVEDLPNGDKAYRLSLSKTFLLLDSKHTHLSQRSTFIAAPNTLGRTFERSWPHDSDPSPYLSPSSSEANDDCKDAQQLRSKIAADIVATLLPPALAVEYFRHLQIDV
ncbi:uncharacterized protein SPSC_01886 [Sporisorium scitamineum]|uniref:Rnh202 triple barrel domain-containing protein n=1 Tax=Sporisorium scitamineum TaxID=49012 RepID=A0A127ZCB5_9BASI|nr:uncharacterized protein SPSC_01886 [Sporisorium scitamineum]